MARFIHKRLAQYPGLWRVDGIGPLAVSGRLGRRAAVYLSGLTEEGLAQPYWKSSLNESTLILPIHSASLREFKVGSIWREGQRVAGPEPIATPYHVDVSQVRLVTLEQAVHLNGQWASTVIPNANLNFGENRSLLASTLYAVLPVLGDRMTHWLVVPTSELLRFYTGVSSRLLSGALQGRLESYVDWDKCRMEDGRPVLHVKQQLNRKEAAVLARAVASPAAKCALFAPHQHLALIQANNAALNEGSKRPLVIKAGFPFTDTTQLYLSGKRMPLTSKNKEGQQQWAVFAMEILVCTHSLGFSGLVLESNDPFAVSGPSGGSGGGAQPPQHKPLLDDDEDEYELENLPADQRLARLVARSYTNQFSAFEGLEFEHRRPRAGGGGNRPGSQIEVPVNAFTVEDGSHASDAEGNQGVSDFQNRVAQVDRDLSLFLDMLKHLRVATARRRWKVVTRRLNDGLVQYGEQIAIFPEKVGKKRTWHKVIDPDGNERTRQVVWVEALLGEAGEYVYLMEMELKPGETGQCTLLLYKHDFSRLEDKTFSELLVLTAVQNRWPDRHNKWVKNDHHKRAKALFAQVQIHRINHPSVPKPKGEDKQSTSVTTKLNPKSWSEALLSKIDELLPVPA